MFDSRVSWAGGSMPFEVDEGLSSEGKGYVFGEIVEMLRGKDPMSPVSPSCCSRFFLFVRNKRALIFLIIGLLWFRPTLIFA
jgi:hypothetical protein